MGFHEYTRHTCLPNAALGSPSHLPPDIRPLWFLSKFGGGSFTFADTPRELEKRERERRHLCESVYIYIYIYIWVFPKIMVPPNHPFNWVFHSKPSILGYPYFWKHPYIHTNLPISDSRSSNESVRFYNYPHVGQMQVLPEHRRASNPTGCAGHRVTGGLANRRKYMLCADNDVYIYLGII